MDRTESQEGKEHLFFRIVEEEKYVKGTVIPKTVALLVFIEWKNFAENQQEKIQKTVDIFVSIYYTTEVLKHRTDGLLVKRSRRRPLTAETRVRFPDRSLKTAVHWKSFQDGSFFFRIFSKPDAGRNQVWKSHFTIPVFLHSLKIHYNQTYKRNEVTQRLCLQSG